MFYCVDNCIGVLLPIGALTRNGVITTRMSNSGLLSLYMCIPWTGKVFLMNSKILIECLDVSININNPQISAMPHLN